MDARLASARTLVALERGQTTLSNEIEKDRRDLSDPRDRALFLEITSGALRWRAELDACLALHSRRPIHDLEPEVRAVLRTAAYQLLHLERVPAHAVVNDAVDVTRRLRQERAAGFVNAVLRNLLRDRSVRDRLPKRPADEHDAAAAAEYLAVTLSHPAWLVTRWLEREGFSNAARWCEFNNTPPDVTVRGNDVPISEMLAEFDRLGVAARPAAFAPNALRMPAGSFGRLAPELQQKLIIHDEGSQLVALAAGVKSGDRVLDLCAAPGGKTLLLQKQAGSTGVVVAADNRPARVRLLRSRLREFGDKQGSPVLALDAAGDLPFMAEFDCVLLDAPCSGLGTVRRDPDVKWSRTAGDLTRFADLQTRMIRAAASIVKPGGVLLYATCSSEPEENDAVVSQFLDEQRNFRQEPVAFSGLEAATSLVDARGHFRSRPYRDDLDAYFAARLVRSRPA